jgi:hypothetical protein
MRIRARDDNPAIRSAEYFVKPAGGAMGTRPTKLPKDSANKAAPPRGKSAGLGDPFLTEIQRLTVTTYNNQQ